MSPSGGGCQGQNEDGAGELTSLLYPSGTEISHDNNWTFCLTLELKLRRRINESKDNRGD